MAVKQVIVSDISGKDIPDDEHARIIVNDHPALNGSPIELDVSADEAAKFQASKVELVSLSIHEINRPVRRVVLDLAGFNALFKGVDMDSIIGNGRRAASETAPASRQRRARGAAKATGDKIDYTAPDHFGQLHRGRVTEEEAKLVRDNLDQANQNRANAGQPAIDPNEEKEKKRYGF